MPDEVGLAGQNAPRGYKDVEGERTSEGAVLLRRELRFSYQRAAVRIGETLKGS
jgi:hypothetical protein